MKKLMQADGTFKIQIEDTDTDVLAVIGGKPRMVKGTYTDSDTLHAVINDALEIATVVGDVAPPVPTQEEIDAREALALLTQTDTDMARTTEDLIDSLIAVGTIAMTDLPQASQDRIAARKLARSLI